MAPDTTAKIRAMITDLYKVAKGATEEIHFSRRLRKGQGTFGDLSLWDISYYAERRREGTLLY